jgi:tetratricopeptide (TPR) repeat protein
MSEPTALPDDSFSGWLQQGQALEARGNFSAAISAYDRAIARAATASAAAPSEASSHRDLGVAWMNRGNVLQKLAADHERHGRKPEHFEATRTAIAAYDKAIAQFVTLPIQPESAWRNHLGAAWLNRGHALLGNDNLEASAASFVSAIEVLKLLPLDDDLSYRLNLAGAWTNLAHVALQACEMGLVSPQFTPARAADAARNALARLSNFELHHVLFAEMSLRARRALVVALGAQLVAAETTRQPTTAFASEASDVLDEGMALARECEKRGAAHLRPLAVRLFRMGAQLYSMHQPQFLAEFLLENVDPAGEHAFAGEGEFRAVAEEALQRALTDLQRPGLIVAGTQEAQRLLSTVRSLREAQVRLSSHKPQLSASST